jgi:cell division protein FtsI (penicillin-binding protein 3)
MARHLKMSVDDARDENSVVIPDVKLGNAAAANDVLYKLGINKRVKEPVYKNDENIVPDVTGMGARDAVFLIESCGLRARLHGRGKVKHQSYPAGKVAMKGSECVLTLDN